MTGADRIPLSIVTGFLGSGKTTLLRRVLARAGLENSCLFVNEIADSGVDDRLLRSITDTVRLIKGGCVCCAARDDLRTALLDLVETNSGSGDVKRIILETTGMANPAPLIEAIVGHPVLNDRIRINGVLALADCLNACANVSTYPEFANQIASADIVVMTKSDMADDDAVKSAIELVRGLNPYANIICGDDGRVAEFLEYGVTMPGISAPGERASLPRPSSAPHSDIRAFRISLEESCDWTFFAIWLSLLVHAHGSHILRVKGLLDIAGINAPVAINCVQNIVYFPEHLVDWPDADRQSLLVFIVRKLEPDRILQSLRAFLGSDRPYLLPPERRHARDGLELTTSL